MWRKASVSRKKFIIVYNRLKLTHKNFPISKQINPNVLMISAYHLNRWRIIVCEDVEEECLENNNNKLGLVDSWNKQFRYTNMNSRIDTQIFDYFFQNISISIFWFVILQDPISYVP